jgi:hypothetical protein
LSGHSNLPFGLFKTVISGALQPLRDELQLNDVQSELIVGATTFGAIIGGLFAGFVRFRFYFTYLSSFFFWKANTTLFYFLPVFSSAQIVLDER